MLAVAGLTVAGASYQAPARRSGKIADIQKVRDNLYFIPGGNPTARPPDPNAPFLGGNVAVFVTENGVVVVDTMLAGMGHMILGQIKSVTNKPVTTIINTHTHFDHSGSNIEFPATVEFVAHENTKTYLSKATCLPVTNCDSFKGENSKFLPKRTFKDRMSLFSGKDRIDLYYFGPGHTGGDAFVVFPAVRAMHSGDIFGLKWVPYIDADNGGSGVSYPETLAKAVAGIANVDTIITGHMGALMKWTDLKEYAAYTAEFLDMVKTGMRSGKSVDEMANTYQLPDKYKDYNRGGERLQNEIQDVHDELTKRTKE
jgi:glyoxylase-like metal-dependent hydrolase (beta-lactamase superfamily II)